MTSPIIDFIEARLEEDFDAATAAGGKEWRQYDPLREHGRIKEVGGDVVTYDEGAPTEGQAVHIARHDPARVLSEVAAKRAILARESILELPEWKPDCGGDWVLSGPGFFANYWPDNTISASITDGFDGPALADSGIVPKESRAACQLFAEEWIRQHLPERSPILRALAAIWPDHPDFDPNWSTT